MTVVFSDGFESGDFTGWSAGTAGTAAVVSSPSPVFQGIYSAKFTNNGSYCEDSLPATYSDMYYRAYAQFSGLALLPNNAVTIHLAIWDNAFSELVGAGVAKDGSGNMQWRIRTQVSADGLFAATIVDDVWYSIELRRVAGLANTAILTLWVDGNLIGTVNDTLATNGGVVQLGNASGYPAGFISYNDSAKVADAYIGPESLAPALGTVLTCLAK